MRLTVAKKLALLTASSALGLAVLIGIAQYQTELVFDKTNDANENGLPSLIVLDELRRDVLFMRLRMNQRIVYDGTPMTAQLEADFAERQRGMTRALQRYETDGCEGKSCVSDATDQEFLRQEKELAAKYKPIVDSVLEAAQKERMGKAREIIAASQAMSGQLDDVIDKHIKYNVAQSKKSALVALAVKESALHQQLALSTALLLLLGGISFVVTRSLLRQLGAEPDDAARVAERLAAGDLSVAVTLRPGDNTSVMAKIMATCRTLERLAIRADAVSQGNLTDEVPLASEKDRLGTAINSMLRILRQGRAQDAQQNWLKDGYGQLSNALSGDMVTQQMADTAICLLGRYLEVGRGVFYLYSASKQELELMSSYMYSERSQVGERFALGVGAVGQVARERKPIVLTVSTDDVQPLVTGTVYTTPRFTYTYPLVHDNELMGVIEFASMQRLDAVQLEFLNTASGMLASYVFVAQQRCHIHAMLVKAEESELAMRRQSEELRESNMRMEMQQQQLQQQTEELQQSNAQMEEQQQQLQQHAEELQQSNAQMELAQTQLEQQNEELAQSQREMDLRAKELDRVSQYKSEFLANMSHELRTPLNSIILLSKMMSSRTDTGPEVGEWSRVIHQSGQDLLRLVNDVLDLSKVEAGQMQLQLGSVSSTGLCAELRGLFAPVAQAQGVGFEIVDTLKGDFHTDAHKLSQILRNLLSNAFKFCKRGTVSLQVRRRSGADVQDHPDLPIAISVRDTGIGVAQDKLDLIFQAFQQADGSTSREFGGTGLGLTISLQLAELLGGTITVQSVPGEGSEFCVLLPDTAGNVGGELQASPSPLPSPQRGEGVIPPHSTDDREQIAEGEQCILLIDDDPVVGRTLVGIHRSQGYKTLIATRGEEGLRLAKLHLPHGILLNLSLPDMDGTQVLHALKNTPDLASIPVQIMSAQSEERLRANVEHFLRELPLQRQDLKAEPSMEVDARSLAHKHLLVVDDDPRNLFVITAALEKHGARISTAVNGRKALDFLHQHTAVDLVLMDVMMPEMNGIEAITAIRADAALAHLRVVAVTAKALTADRDEVLAAGANDYLVKPIDYDLLLATVVKWSAGVAP